MVVRLVTSIDGPELMTLKYDHETIGFLNYAFFSTPLPSYK
jgi:hypothetical protein